MEVPHDSSYFFNLFPDFFGIFFFRLLISNRGNPRPEPVHQPPVSQVRPKLELKPRTVTDEIGKPSSSSSGENPFGGAVDQEKLKRQAEVLDLIFFVIDQTCIHAFVLLLLDTSAKRSRDSC